MTMKSLMAAGLLLAGSMAAHAQATDALAEAGIPTLSVDGFSDRVPTGMPLFAALPQMAPGAEVDLRQVSSSGLVAFDATMPRGIDPNADIATGSVTRRR